MKPTLLFVGAGIETKPAIEIAKNMGIHTVASDMSLSAPGILVSDDYFIASTYDIDKTFNFDVLLFDIDFKTKHLHFFAVPEFTRYAFLRIVK